jgi:hypothetical protein
MLLGVRALGTGHSPMDFLKSYLRREKLQGDWLGCDDVPRGVEVIPQVVKVAFFRFVICSILG